MALMECWGSLRAFSRRLALVSRHGRLDDDCAHVARIVPSSLRCLGRAQRGEVRIEGELVSLLMLRQICDECQLQSADTRHGGHERAPCRHHAVVIASTDDVHQQRSDADHRGRGGQRDRHRDEVHHGARSGHARRPSCTTTARQAEH